MERITASLTTLERELTAHAQGFKQVFIKNTDTPSKTTQVAYGEFTNTDYCELHTHHTMEEYFFFLRGRGIYIIGDNIIDLTPGVFVRIPAGTPHRMETISMEPLEYVYFGVALD